MVQGGGVEGREGSGSGALLTESSDISRRIRSNLLKRERERERERGNDNSTNLFFSAYTSVFTLHLTLKLLSLLPLQLITLSLILIIFHRRTLHLSALTFQLTVNFFQGFNFI